MCLLNCPHSLPTIGEIVTELPRPFDYQERWHGFGSAIGAGFLLLSLGGTALLVSVAVHI